MHHILFFSTTDVSKDGDKEKKKRKKKEVFYIKYSEKVDFDKFFFQSRKGRKKNTTLSKATLDKYSKSKTTLPEDLHYDADKLFRLFSKGKTLVSQCGLYTRFLNFRFLSSCS